MSVFYLETSAWLKKYRREPGTDIVLELFSNARQEDRFITSRLTVLEMDMTAARYLNGGLLRPAQYRRFVARFASDIMDYRIRRVPVNDGVLDEAAILVPQYPLRAADAIHFATAGLVSQAVGDQPYYVVSGDNDLVQVCVAYNIKVLNLYGQYSALYTKEFALSFCEPKLGTNLGLSSQ